MRVSAILAIAGVASAQAAYGAGAPTTTIQTTTTQTMTKTVYAATHTSVVTIQSNSTTAASSGFARPTGNSSMSTGKPSTPIATSAAADSFKTGAAQGALVGAIFVGALLF